MTIISHYTFVVQLDADLNILTHQLTYHTICEGVWQEVGGSFYNWRGVVGGSFYNWRGVVGGSFYNWRGVVGGWPQK